MLSRRQLTSKIAASTVLCQRRFDHERWYGHAAEMDVHNYKYTGEVPSWQKPTHRSPEQTQFTKYMWPKVDFAPTYEALLFDADRLNLKINRKEFGNEIKYRLEKQANTVARAQQLIKDGTYANDVRTEDTMIARIADEEHVQAEMKYVKCIRANELAEDNRLDILPGGSPNSLREKTRWNINVDLHSQDRAEIAQRLTAWLPEKYHIVYYDDFQTVAANAPEYRDEMKKIVANVKKEHEAEAKAGGFEADLNEVVAELEDDVDPTRHITADAIAKSSNLEELEKWSREVHEYNGDERIFQIYARAAELTKNEDHKKLVANMVQWMKNAKSLA